MPTYAAKRGFGSVPARVRLRNDRSHGDRTRQSQDLQGVRGVQGKNVQQMIHVQNLIITIIISINYCFIPRSDRTNIGRNNAKRNEITQGGFQGRC